MIFGSNDLFTYFFKQLILFALVKSDISKIILKKTNVYTIWFTPNWRDSFSPTLTPIFPPYFQNRMH